MISIVLPVSRPDYLDMVFATLEFMTCDKEQVNLLTIVDGDNQLFVDVRNRTDKSKFKDRLCVQFKDQEKMKNHDIMHRRYRIAKIHNYAKQFIQRSDYIFCIEDDTSFGADTLKKLLKDYAEIPFAGLIQGFQIGRHGINHFGAWKVDDVYEPTVIKSQLRAKNTIGISDAGGLYCTLTKAENYMAHEFEPFADALGPDFNYGIELRKQGYINYTDWSLPCNHHTKSGIINATQQYTQKVQFIKGETRWRQKSL